MELYITGLPSAYEVEHVARLFFPAAHLAAQCPETGDRLLARVEGETAEVCLFWEEKALEGSVPVGDSPSFALSSLVYDLARQATGVRPSWGKMTGVRPVRLIHDNRRRGMGGVDLAHALGNTAIPLPAMIPWSIAVSVPLAAMDASALAIPFACFLYLCPLCDWLSWRRRERKKQELT